MRTRVMAVVLGLAVLGWASPSFGGLCGDANSDSTVNLIDLISIIDYLRDYPQSPPIDLDNADCDGITSVTVSDAVRFSNHIFYLTPLNCQDTGTYGYQLSPNDTVLFPRMLGIPDGVESVRLPVITSFQASVQGFYFPFLHYGDGADSLFEYVGADYGGSSILVAGDLVADTTVLIGVDVYKDQFAGRHELFTLMYDRVAAGTSDVRPELTDRMVRLRIAIEKNGQLYQPVIAFYDVEAPPEFNPWGDLNCDGQTNVEDLTLLVGYLFLGQPPPAPCE